MELYGGTNNASRIAGEYMYTARVYNKNPVEQINAIKAQNIEKEIAAQNINEIDFDSHKASEIKNKYDSEKKSTTLYESAAFRNSEFSQKGLLLNILG